MIECTVKGNKLTIVADIEKGHPSATGKTQVVATTSGFVGVPGTTYKVSLNVTGPRS
jgi:hypothetical protein